MMHRSISHTLLLASFMALAAPATASNPVKKVAVHEEHLVKLSEADQQRALAIRDRLEEMMAMDRKAMDRSEKRAMREEVRTLKAEAEVLNQRAGGSVIYISTAGLIIIILLLIILL